MGIFLSGCATIIEGTTQRVSVTTQPVSGAACTLVNERGRWTLTSSSAVEVKRSTSPLNITCKKEGYQDAVGTLNSHTSDGTSVTALLLGPVGVGIDAASGATFHYPNGIVLTLVPNAAPASDQASDAAKAAP